MLPQQKTLIFSSFFSYLHDMQFYYDSNNSAFNIKWAYFLL